MDRRIIELYDEYTHAPLDRRTFLERLSVLAGGASAAYALLPVLENNYARAAMVPADDPAIKVERASVTGASGTVNGYLAMPAGSAKAPGLVVIHENRGLNAHIEDVARRAAKAGFVAFAPDLLSPLGGTPPDQDQAREMIGKLDPGTTVGDLRGVVAMLAEHPASTGKVGVVGFCWGGGMTNRLAAAEPSLKAAVSFYGPPAPLDQVPAIKAPLQLHYAGLDKRVNEMVIPYIEALDFSEKPYEKFMYDGVDHAFHNDTNAARYNADAAKLAWERTVAFLTKNLS